MTPWPRHTHTHTHAAAVAAAVSPQGDTCRQWLIAPVRLLNSILIKVLREELGVTGLSVAYPQFSLVNDRTRAELILLPHHWFSSSSSFLPPISPEVSSERGVKKKKTSNLFKRNFSPQDVFLLGSSSYLQPVGPTLLRGVRPRLWQQRNHLLPHTGGKLSLILELFPRFMDFQSIQMPEWTVVELEIFTPSGNSEERGIRKDGVYFLHKTSISEPDFRLSLENTQF